MNLSKLSYTIKDSKDSDKTLKKNGSELHRGVLSEL